MKWNSNTMKYEAVYVSVEAEDEVDIEQKDSIKNISDSEKVKLENLDCLIIDCLRHEKKHPTHIILPESIALARELKPKKCYFCRR